MFELWVKLYKVLDIPVISPFGTKLLLFETSEVETYANVALELEAKEEEWDEENENRRPGISGVSPVSFGYNKK